MELLLKYIWYLLKTDSGIRSFWILESFYPKNACTSKLKVRRPYRKNLSCTIEYTVDTKTNQANQKYKISCTGINYSIRVLQRAYILYFIYVYSINYGHHV